MSESQGGSGADRGISTGRMVALVLVGILSAILIFSNLQSAEVRFLGLSFEMPVFILLIVVFILGMLLGGLVRRGVRRLAGRGPRTE